MAISDWDFVVATDDFDAVTADIGRLVAPLRPLAEQWDPLSAQWCYMLMLRGPVKVDLIFDHRHEPEPPWTPAPQALMRIDDHFWDWVLWLAAKVLAGRRRLVESELEKMFRHLLGPVGVRDMPDSLHAAVQSYLEARSALERRFAVRVPRELEREVLPVVWRASS
jgi:hypothetical protein